ELAVAQRDDGQTELFRLDFEADDEAAKRFHDLVLDDGVERLRYRNAPARFSGRILDPNSPDLALRARCQGFVERAVDGLSVAAALDIGGDDIAGRALRHELPVLEQDRLSTQAADGAQIVADEQDGTPFALDLAHAAEALLLKM